MSEKNYSVFVSYCGADGAEFAENLKRVLDGIGYSSFVSQISMRDYAGIDDIPGLERIMKIIDKCTYFVLVLTPEALNSKIVRQEIARAQSTNRKILPFYKKPELKSSEIKEPYSLNGAQFEQFNTREDLSRFVVRKIMDIEHIYLESLGIKAIFENRHSESYAKAVTDCIKGLNGGEVRMLGISFKDWFGDPSEGKQAPKFAGVLKEALEKEIRFKILLIDPTSDIAKERAIVESGVSYKNDKKYINSPLFQDIKKVALWIANSEKTCRDKGQQPCIEAHFYDFMLSIYAIITPTYTFIEQYHIGGIPGLRAPGDESALCLGGYVPVFMIYNTSHFGIEIKDHFTKIWEHSLREEEAKGNSFENVLKNTALFEQDALSFRLQQYTIKTYRRCSNLIEMLKKYDEKDRMASNY
jgi:hypothetical protein